MNEIEKIIIVEGRSDKKKVKPLIKEEVEIICTHGTIGVEKLDEMIEEYDLDHRDVYILVDPDESGVKLRKQLVRELPHSTQLYIDQIYQQVENAPEYHLAYILVGANIDVYPEFLTKK